MSASVLRPVSLLAIVLSACTTGRSVVGGDVPDAAEPADLAADLPSPADAPDAPNAPDAPAPVDVPAARCAADSDCAASPLGPACDVATGLCVPCTVASDRCPAGQYCVASMGRCAPGCRDDAACAATADQTRCDPTSRACVACLADDHCPAGNLCVAGSCVNGCSATSRCPAGRTCCGGACVDPRSDVAHCGACDHRCALTNANATACRDATCAVMTCALPFADCDGVAANGCETDTRTSATHCGACGDRCAPAGATGVCSAGRCTVASCEPGRADCNADPGDGCEAATAGDPMNCGACGAVCPEVGGGRRCFAGTCAPRSCAAILAMAPGAASGPYLLDLDGDGPGAARAYACDMRDGGWTVVANQVPAELLADSAATLGEPAFGDVTRSWRLGNPDITRVRPGLAWRLSDEVTNVYVVPACVVDWTRDYVEVRDPTECTLGYTTTALNVVVNGAWTYCSARGIGINNNGRHCSIRMNEGGFERGVGAMANGRAYTCDYNTARRVSLAFR